MDAGREHGGAGFVGHVQLHRGIAGGDDTDAQPGRAADGRAARRTS